MRGHTSHACLRVWPHGSIHSARAVRTHQPILQRGVDLLRVRRGSGAPLEHAQQFEHAQ
jgi:hypothetical protein